MYTRRLALAAVLVLAASMLFVQAALALCPTMPGAQGRGPGMHRGMGPGMMPLDKMTTELGLTPEQVSKIQAIRESARTQRQAVVADKTLSREVRRTRLREIARTTHQQMMSVLTPEQQTKLTELREKRKAGKFDKMSTALGLTADQQTQIRAIKDRMKSDLRAIKDNTSLSDADKRAQAKQVKTNAMAEIRALLTPEQQQKLDSMHKRHKGAKAGRAGAGPAVQQTDPMTIY